MSTQPKAYQPYISKWRQKARGYAAGKFDTFIFNENYYAVYSVANGKCAVVIFPNTTDKKSISPTYFIEFYDKYVQP